MFVSLWIELICLSAGLFFRQSAGFPNYWAIQLLIRLSTRQFFEPSITFWAIHLLTRQFVRFSYYWSDNGPTFKTINLSVNQFIDLSFSHFGDPSISILTGRSANLLIYETLGRRSVHWTLCRFVASRAYQDMGFLVRWYLGPSACASIVSNWDCVRAQKLGLKVGT